MEPYAPDTWHDFFLAAAGAAAALTGLLFVALSIHIRYIAADVRYRTMARGSLVGLVTVLILSLVVLIRAPATWTGWEVVAVSVAYLIIEGGYQIVSLRRARWRVGARTLAAPAVGQLLALVGAAGALGIVFRFGPGLYAVALTTIVVLVWNLWDAWVLLIGVADEEISQDAH